jgi:hypothetical protein
MEKTSRNIEVDPGQSVILRSPETQNLLATARWLMRLTLKPSFELPESVTPGPASNTGRRFLLIGIFTETGPTGEKGSLVIAPGCLLSKVRDEVYNSHWP